MQLSMGYKLQSSRFSTVVTILGHFVRIKDNSVRLVKNGTIVGNNKAATGTDWTSAETAVTYGVGTTDLWGTTWTPSDINNANFGLVLSVLNATAIGSSYTASVDFIQITITYTVPGSLNWYTVSSGGSIVQSGTPFNPINDPQVIAAGPPYSSLTNTNTPGTYTFYVECSSVPGCRTPTNLVINPIPTVSFSGFSTSTFCANDGAVTLTGNHAPAGTFSGPGITDNFNGTASFNPATAGAGGPYTITYSYTDANSCTNTSSQNVSVNPLPAATISGSTTVCQNSPSPNITFTGSNGTAPYTFTYTINNGSPQTISTISGNSVTVAALTNTVGTITYALVSVQDASSTTCSQNLAGIATISINGVDGGEIADDQLICYGGDPEETTSITDGSGSGAITYRWEQSTDGGSNWTPISGASSLTYDPPATLTGSTKFRRITISTLNAVSCEASSNVITVTSPSAPFNATVNKTDLTCIGANDGTITITNPTGGFGTFEYSIDGGNNWLPDGSFTGLAADTYIVMIRDATFQACEFTLNGALQIIVNDNQPPVITLL